jgi:pseudouridine-5'-phosphate glycosidase
MTPYLLDYVDRATSGRAREANLALLEQNAALAADIAVALSAALNSAVTSE